MEARRQQGWLWVTHPPFAQDEDDPTQDRPDLSPGSTGNYWTCHEDHQAGELALLYVTDPFSEVRWLLRAETNARLLMDAIAQQEGWTHGCVYTVLERFAKPVTYQELRQDQQLARRDAISRNLQGEHGAWPVRRAIGRGSSAGSSAAIRRPARASTDNRASRRAPRGRPRSRARAREDLRRRLDGDWHSALSQLPDGRGTVRAYANELLHGQASSAR